MMSQTYRTPPSRLLGIDDPYEAWGLDEAVADYTLRIAAGAVPKSEQPEDDRPKNNLDLIARIKAAQAQQRRR